MKTSHKFLCIGIVCLTLSIPFGYLSFTEEQYCGIVIEKHSTTEGSTHKSSTTFHHNDYIGFRCSDGHYEKKSVDYNSYMTHAVGDRICFNRPKYSCAFIIGFSIFLMGAFIGVLGYYIE